MHDAYHHQTVCESPCMNYSLQLNGPYRPISVRDPFQPPDFSATNSSANLFSAQRISKRVPFRDRPDIFRGR